MIVKEQIPTTLKPKCNELCISLCTQAVSECLEHLRFLPEGPHLQNGDKPWCAMKTSIEN